MSGAGKRGGVLSKVRTALNVRRGYRAATAARASSRIIGAGARGAGRGVARLGARAAGTPVGLIVGALAIAGVVALRLASGQPLEKTGEIINQMFLGDLDNEARAKMRTRDQLESNPDLLRIAGQDGFNSQLKDVADNLYNINKRDVDGEELFRREFPSNNILDMLILRARDKFVALWKGNGDDAKLATMVERLGAASEMHPEARGAR